MYALNFNLPRDNNKEVGTLPAGVYKVTVTGVSGQEFVSIDGWNGSAWAVLDAAINASESGIIGAASITVPASGRVRCFLNATGNTNAAKVRISK